MRVRIAFIFFIAITLLAFVPTASFAAGSVTLAWQPSTDTNVTGYNLYYGGASGVYTNKITTANITNLVVSGLVEGATYYFAATAYDNSGAESPFSNEASYAVPFNSISSAAPTAASPPPTLNTIGDLVIDENGGPQTVELSGINPAASNEIQTVTASSSNPALIAAPTVSYVGTDTTGTITFAPATNATGTATITVTVDNGQTQSNTITRTFTVTVNAMTPAATVNANTNLYLNENGSALTVNLTGLISVAANISSATANKKQAVKFSAVSANRKLLPTPTIRSSASSATMTIKPARNEIGTTTITVTMNSGTKNNSATKQTFIVTVLAKGPGMPATLTPAVHGSGQFALAIAGSPGKQYIVEASTNMVNWVPVQTNTAPFTFTDTHAGEFNQRFYRSIASTE